MVQRDWQWWQQAGDAGELGAAAAKLFASIRSWVVERAGQTGEQGGAEDLMVLAAGQQCRRAGRCGCQVVCQHQEG